MNVECRVGERDPDARDGADGGIAVFVILSEDARRSLRIGPVVRRGPRSRRPLRRSHRTI